MATIIGELVAKLRADTSQWTRGMADAQTSMGKLSTAITGLGGLVGFSVMGVSALAAGRAVVKAADEMGDAAELIKNQMGSAGDAVVAWADATAAAMGRSRTQVRGLVGEFQSLTGNSGASQTLAKLTIDFAAFRKISSEDAFGALRAGIMGRDMELRRLGVSLDEARLNALSMAEGFGVAFDKLTDGEKIIVRLKGYTQELAVAEGAAAAEAGGWSESVTRFSASVTELAAGMGNDLLPALTHVVHGFTLLLQGVEKLRGMNPSSVGAGGKLAGEVGGYQLGTGRAPLSLADLQPVAGQEERTARAKASLPRQLAEVARLEAENEAKAKEHSVKAAQAATDATKSFNAELAKYGDMLHQDIEALREWEAGIDAALAQELDPQAIGYGDLGIRVAETEGLKIGGDLQKQIEDVTRGGFDILNKSLERMGILGQTASSALRGMASALSGDLAGAIVGIGSAIIEMVESSTSATEKAQYIGNVPTGSPLDIARRSTKEYAERASIEEASRGTPAEQKAFAAYQDALLANLHNQKENAFDVAARAWIASMEESKRAAEESKKATEDNTEAARDLADALLNLPEGFKLASKRFGAEAANPRLGGAA